MEYEVICTRKSGEYYLATFPTEVQAEIYAEDAHRFTGFDYEVQPVNIIRREHPYPVESRMRSFKRHKTPL